MYNTVFKKLLLNKTNPDRFRLKFLRKKKSYSINTLLGKLKIIKSLKKVYTNRFTLKHSKKEPVTRTQIISRNYISKTTTHASLRLLDIRGEILMKNLL